MITITIDIGNGPRDIIVDHEQLTIGFLEDMEDAAKTGDWKDTKNAIAKFLKLSNDEMRSLTIKQFKDITSVLLSASTEETIPNE